LLFCKTILESIDHFDVGESLLGSLIFARSASFSDSWLAFGSLIDSIKPRKRLLTTGGVPSTSPPQRKSSNDFAR